MGLPPDSSGAAGASPSLRKARVTGTGHPRSSGWLGPKVPHGHWPELRGGWGRKVTWGSLVSRVPFRLRPFTSYKLRLKATNDIGDSDFSAETEAVTTLQDGE